MTTPSLAHRIAFALCLLVVTFAAAGFAGQAPQPPPGITREAVHEDAKVMIARLTMAPGARETVHTHPFDAVVVQITPGEVEMTVGDKKTSGRKPAGDVTLIPRDTPHAAVNIGKTDVLVVTVAIKQ